MKIKPTFNSLTKFVILGLACMALIGMYLQVVALPVFAVTATSAEGYCTGTVGNTGSPTWSACVDSKEAELAECDAITHPAERAECKESALTYGESEAGEVEVFTPPAGIECEGVSDHCCNGVVISIDVDCVESDNPILSYLIGAINFLAAGALLIIVVGIIWGGIEYITAGGVPQRLESARTKITNSVIALVTFLFMYGILQWLVPGGIF